MARQSVVGDRLPVGRVGDELTIRRADAGIAVERAEADSANVAVARVNRPESRAAARAEALQEAPVARVVGGDEVISRGDPERAWRDSRLRRRARAGAALTACAVAVARRDERLGHLVTDRATE